MPTILMRVWGSQGSGGKSYKVTKKIRKRTGIRKESNREKGKFSKKPLSKEARRVPQEKRLYCDLVVEGLKFISSIVRKLEVRKISPFPRTIHKGSPWEGSISFWRVPSVLVRPHRWPWKFWVHGKQPTWHTKSVRLHFASCVTQNWPQYFERSHSPPVY